MAEAPKFYAERCEAAEHMDRAPHWIVFDRHYGVGFAEFDTEQEATDLVGRLLSGNLTVEEVLQGKSEQDDTMLVAVKPEAEVEGDMHVYFGNRGVTDGLPVWFYDMDLTNADALAVVEALLQEMLRTGHPKVARLRSGPGYVMTV